MIMEFKPPMQMKNMHSLHKEIFYGTSFTKHKSTKKSF